MRLDSSSSSLDPVVLSVLLWSKEDVGESIDKVLQKESERRSTFTSRNGDIVVSGFGGDDG